MFCHTDRYPSSEIFNFFDTDKQEAMSRYDSRTNMFSPEGRVYQVEYAMESIYNAGAAVAITTQGGVVLAAEKRIPSPLLDGEKAKDTSISGDKLFRIDDHVGVAVAGMTSDANILIDHARTAALRHQYTYHEGIAVESLALQIANVKQWYTQSGGQRPFGVAFLMAGYDACMGYQLYYTDPSGNYSRWKAHAIGNNSNTAQSLLKSDWKADLSLHDGILLGLKILSRALDLNSLTTERIELGVLAETEPKEQTKTRKTGAAAFPTFRVVPEAELKIYLEQALKLKEAEEVAAKQKEAKQGMDF